MFFNCGTQVMPAVVHPTQCCVKHNLYNCIVPEVFPSHTTTVNHKNIEHQLYFPHTESVVNEVTNSQVVMPGPGPGFGPMGGPGFGPMGGPGFGPMGGPGYPPPRPW